MHVQILYFLHGQIALYSIWSMWTEAVYPHKWCILWLSFLPIWMTNFYTANTIQHATVLISEFKTVKSIKVTSWSIVFAWRNQLGFLFNLKWIYFEDFHAELIVLNIVLEYILSSWSGIHDIRNHEYHVIKSDFELPLWL